MPNAGLTPPERRSALVAALRTAFDDFMDAFLDRRQEVGPWVDQVTPERLASIRDEYRSLQRRVAAAYRPVRDLFQTFVEQEPHYDRRGEVAGDFAYELELDYPLTSWWSPLTFDEALNYWGNADDQHIRDQLDRQRAVLDAFADWAGEEHAGDRPPEPSPALTSPSLVRTLTGAQPPAAEPSSRHPVAKPSGVEGGWLRRILTNPWTITVVGGLIVGGILLFLGLRLTGDSDGSAAPQPPPTCVIEGQAVELDGTPVVAARIIARQPDRAWIDDVGLNPQAPILATTDGEGRFETNCDTIKKPFVIGVAWEIQLASDEWCEFWNGPTSYIEADGMHRDLTIQIPRDEVELHVYRYADDYYCTS